ncbi:MAG TPA: metallophosphoesterase [Pirellulaceae bacterium]|nr:metallophosphoesterase [Pirellulaceae bacterium]
MNLARDLALALMAFVGHFALAVWLFNRLHAIPWPVRLIKILDKFIILAAAAVCVVFLARWLITGQALLPRTGEVVSVSQWIWLGYAMLCWSGAIAVLPLWLIPKLRERMPPALVANDSTVVDVAERIGFRPIQGLKTKILARVPGNEIFQIAVQRKTLRVPSLPPALDGLSIAHLSDLHMTGHLGPEFYEVIVEETNAQKPDLIVLTGDILEKKRCLKWGPPILSRLRARFGTYFIFGNHEKRLKDPGHLRQALIDAGLIDLGGRAIRTTIRDMTVVLVGNELPWFGTAPMPELRTPHSAFRILLSHTPDQLPWAKSNQFDLMLAGHNHGGQIRLPWIGALIVPSHYGWRYAGGLYHEPPTLLHVSRGLAGDHCIRLNCPPELALLVLTSADRQLS